MTTHYCMILVHRSTIVVQCVLRRTTVRKSQVFLTPTVADFLPWGHQNAAQQVPIAYNQAKTGDHRPCRPSASWKYDRSTMRTTSYYGTQESSFFDAYCSRFSSLRASECSAASTNRLQSSENWRSSTLSTKRLLEMLIYAFPDNSNSLLIQNFFISPAIWIIRVDLYIYGCYCWNTKEKM